MVEDKEQRHITIKFNVKYPPHENLFNTTMIQNIFTVLAINKKAVYYKKTAIC